MEGLSPEVALSFTPTIIITSANTVACFQWMGISKEALCLIISTDFRGTFRASAHSSSSPIILCQSWGGDLFTVTSREVYTLDTDPPVHYSDWEWVNKLGHSFTLEENWIDHMVPVQTSMRLVDIIPCEEPVLLKCLNYFGEKNRKRTLKKNRTKARETK